VYTVKVCELITHIKKFKGTKTLVKDFGMIADILGARMGCLLFQLPPSYRYTKTRLNDIVSQLDPARRNVVEFRHASWWNDEVYSAFRKAGTSSAPAADRACPMSLSAQPMKYMSACTAQNDGTGTTTQKTNSQYGRTKSKPAGRSEPGSISITTTMPMRPNMPQPCGGCWAASWAQKRRLELCQYRKRSQLFRRTFDDE
jgi:hypothetical protein